MIIYSVGNETYYSLKEAKAVMKDTGLKGYKTKVYSNGDWVPCGEISLTGSNRTRIVGANNSNSYI